MEWNEEKKGKGNRGRFILLMEGGTRDEMT